MKTLVPKMEIENSTIIKLLNYLSPEQWADAFINHTGDDTEIMELIREQSKYYSHKHDLKELVLKELLTELGRREIKLEIDKNIRR